KLLLFTIRRSAGHNDLQRVAVQAMVAFLEMHVLAVRISEVIDPCPFIETEQCSQQKFLRPIFQPRCRRATSDRDPSGVPGRRLSICLRLYPARSRFVGAFISADQCSTLPLSSVTSKYSCE